MGLSTLHETGRAALIAELAEARRQTDLIFALLRPEAIHARPIPHRHRFIFYLGHLEAFDWNLIARRICHRDSFHGPFDRLFAFGIDPTEGPMPDEPASAWPERRGIEAYNQQAREGVDACLAGRADPRDREVTHALEMAIEHRLMHAETLAYMLRWLPHASKEAPAVPPLPRGLAQEAPGGMVGIPSGVATLGRRRTDPGFGWDNEFEEHSMVVPAFAIDRHKVTNDRYLEFVRDRGYEVREFWTESAWRWKEASGLRHPAGWEPRGGAWLERGTFADRPLCAASPVLVSQAEAAAFARWAGGALPSEAQYHRAAFGTPGGSEQLHPWGEEEPEARFGNFGLQRWDPTPVHAHPAGVSAFGVGELVGNGWEWTSSIFGPFPGFQADPHYPGYSEPFFDSAHFVLKGASPRTATRFVRRAFRNWFQAHYSYALAAFRVVE